jgi:dTDP-4-dehydrorhamnose 3,5-epimerase
MKFIKSKIKDAYYIQPEPFVDERGIFRRHFCFKEFKQNGIPYNVEQANLSENKYPYTLRGFHYQVFPYQEGKTLSCLKGSIFDIILDLREESPTYMQWESFELSDKNRNSIFIPPGCANAFLTLSENCLIHYYCSKSYNPDAEKGIRYNDPSFNFIWPRKPEVISEKDLNHPDYKKIR